MFLDNNHQLCIRVGYQILALRTIHYIAMDYTFNAARILHGIKSCQKMILLQNL
jgi:hypothetical protein